MASDAALLARWEKLMAAIERPFIRAIVIEKNRYIRAAAETFKRTQQLEPLDFDEHAAGMQALFNQYLTLAIRAATGEVLDGKKGRAPQTRDDLWGKLWLYLAQRWLDGHAGAMARETALTTRADLQSIIEAAFEDMDDFNPAAVAIRMLRARALSRPRAETIALTEVHNAMMFASEGSAQRLATDEGITMLKRWVPVQDERTRINHASMAAVAPIPLDADFTVGGERMSRPGDPRGGASNVIRCRCVLAYEVLE